MSRHTTHFGVFHITPKPDLPQVGIVHGVYILAEFRGQGLGSALVARINQQLELEHYDAAICTTAGDNTPMQKCLFRAGWKMLTTFHNRKTVAPHQIWGMEVSKV